MNLLKTAVSIVGGPVGTLAAGVLAGSSASRDAEGEKDLAGIAPSVVNAAVTAGLAAASRYTDPVQQAKAFRDGLTSVSPGVHYGAADALTRHYFPSVSTSTINPHDAGGIGGLVQSILPPPLTTSGARTTADVSVNNGKVSGGLSFDSNPQTMQMIGALVLIVIVVILLKKLA